MGHERLGILPKTATWQKVVAQIGAFSNDQADISAIVFPPFLNPFPLLPGP